MTVQEQAKAYLALGWSVFPLRPLLKTPAGPWNDFRTRRLTNDEVDKMFQADSNLAVACGELSNILVVDQDIYKGKVGFENLDSPLKAISPNGGVHLFFKYSPGMQNTVNEHKATDIRSEGGYVGIYPSVINTENGGRGQYTWVSPPTKELLETLPEAPKWLFEAVYSKDTTNVSKKTFMAPVGEDFAPVEKGGRNNEISRYSLSMLSRYKDPKIAWQLVLARNASFHPPLPLAEVQPTFMSALNKYNSTKAVGGGISNDVLQQVKENVDFKPTTLRTDVDFTIQQLIQGKKKGYSTGYLELDALIGGLQPGQSYLIFADTNVGKSMMAVNILVSMAKSGVKCAYFDLENDTAFSTERIMMVANEGRIHLMDYRAELSKQPIDFEYLKKIFTPVYELEQNLDVWSMTKMLDRFGEITWPGIKTVIDEKIKEGVQVIVIDHLHYFSPAETDHAVLGEISRQINNYAAEFNLAIVCVAHTKKGLTENKKGKEENEVRVVRPTVDHINGSGMIAKHFKNLIAIRRNYASSDPDVQKETRVYVDKTKYGPAGSYDLFFDPMTFLFQVISPEKRLVDMKQRAMDDILDQQIVLPLEQKPPEIIEQKPPEVEVEVETEKEVFVPLEVEYVKPKVFHTEKKLSQDEINQIPF